MGLLDRVDERLARAGSALPVGQVETGGTNVIPHPASHAMTPPAPPPAPAPLAESAAELAIIESILTGAETGELPPPALPPEATETERLRAELDRVNMRWKSFEGAVRLREDRIAALQAELDQARAQVTPPPATSAPPVVTPMALPVEELTAEELEAYTRSLPVIQKTARKVFQTERASLVSELNALKEEINQLRTGVVASRQDASAQNEALFMSAIQDRVRDLKGITSHPEYNEFLDNPVSDLTGMTYRDALNNAYGSRDVERTVKILSVVGTALNGAGPPMAPVIPMLSQAYSATSRLPEPPKKPTLPLSKLREASDLFRRRKIGLDAYERVVAMYQQAGAEGRVNEKA